MTRDLSLIVLIAVATYSHLHADNHQLHQQHKHTQHVSEASKTQEKHEEKVVQDEHDESHVHKHHMAHAELNQGGIEKPPFLNLHAGREGYLHARHPINEDRLYDFYDRQAKYYLKQATLPPVLVGFPGLEGGVNGHWGKGSKNSFESDAWNRMDIGRVFAGIINTKYGQVRKAVTARLGDSQKLSCVFDPKSASIREVWIGGIGFKVKRFGLVGGVIKQGTSVFGTAGAIKPNGYQYLGYFRHGERVIFQYKVKGATVLDAPWAEHVKTVKSAQPVFTRSFSMDKPITHAFDLLQPNHIDRHEINEHTAILYQGQKVHFVSLRGNQSSKAAFSITEREVKIGKTNKTKRVKRLELKLNEVTGNLQLAIWSGNKKDLLAIQKLVSNLAIEDLNTKVKGSRALWPMTISAKGQLDYRDIPYAIDTIPVPHDNPYKSMMFIGDHDFYKNGDAAVCTIMGDVWHVTGIDHELKKVTWRRIATGLHQPLGLKVVDDKIYVLGKDQITRLHDLNGDGEMDHYECYSNDYRTSQGGHDYATGLGRDLNGNFYFVTGGDGAIKVKPNGTSEVIARGIRNPNGVGVRHDGLMVTAPQEGTWAPTTSIIEVNPGEFYGYRAKTGDKIHAPLCFVPRGIDSSAGGQIFVDSIKWGPLDEQLIGFSYGLSTHYMVMRDVIDGVAQGAIVPLYSEFLSGSHRGRFHPVDGQLYVSGADGWGNYAQEHGCFQRVRYTGKPVNLPVQFRAHANGVKITFTRALDPASVKDVTKYLAQQWNYIMSESYGSAEFSVRNPNMTGHDKVDITSAHLLEDGKTIFLEMPEIIPVMQMHIHGELKAVTGESFTFNMFPTLKKLDQAFEFKGAKAIAKKPLDLVMRINWTKKTLASGAGKAGRVVLIKAIPGLKYDKTVIRVKRGERLSLTLVNRDQMQHNLVIVKPGALQKVGLAAMKMVSHPDAFSMSYTPEMPEVLIKVPVVSPSERFVYNFNAPKKPGEYPFLCTFPGHWSVMNGKLIVE